MYIDKVTIKVKGGKGGDGSTSFYRAKYVPKGGPDGGDGGRGGDVIFQADRNLTTLLDFRYKRSFAATDGDDGSKRNRSGKSGEDIIIKVPIGTIIREVTSGKIMADLREDGEIRILAKGGRGGRGNQHFATSVRQAPKYSEKGKEGKRYSIILELKTIADVGLIGFPNAGKSTFLSMATNAKPKIANYHFTTLSPNLGVVRTGYDGDYVLADIPGLVEGASEGIGLGHDFLRHIERTKVLIHVVDASGVEGNDPVEAIETINNELEKYNSELLKRPQIIVANKMDIPEAAENYEKIKEKYQDIYEIYPCSAASNSGIDEVITAAGRILNEYPEDIKFVEDYEEYEEIEPDYSAYEIEVTEDKRYIVTGTGIERMIINTNMDTEKGFAFFQKYLRDKGVIAALEEKGIEDGDTVELYGLEFDYYK